MKLKEFPRSLVKALQLKRLGWRELHADIQAPLPVIVSLTSIPSRLQAVALTVRSLLAQNAKPQQIILWLNDQLQGKLPKALVQLQGEKFAIRFVDLTCPHRKLIHSLAEFPNNIIVTCDDDLMYDASWLARLYADHLRYPQAVIAHQCRRVSFDEQGQPRPYKDWPFERARDVTDTWLMSVGFGGVLYPPGCLYGDVLKRDLFLALTPRADDLWFKAMSLLAGTQVRRSSNPGARPLPIWGTQRVSLKRTNVRGQGNSEQWQALFEHYDLGRYVARNG